MKPKRCIIIEFEPEEKKILTKLTKKIKNDQQIWHSKIKEWEDVEMSNEPIVADFKKYLKTDQEKLDILDHAKNGVFCERKEWTNFADTIQHEIYSLEENDIPLEKLNMNVKRIDFRMIRSDF